MLHRLRIPIVQAPMAGGPSTPALAAAVSETGALGFLAAGYKTVDAMATDIEDLRARTPAPFGINLFGARPTPTDPAAVAAYAERLAPWARDAGVELGLPRSDDDALDAKLERLLADPVAVVSFTFACPPPETVAALRDAGTSVWVTVTNAAEARAAVAAGADALVAQGAEAGGHRGGFDDAEEADDLGLLALLQVLRRAVDVPLVATGGIATGDAVAAVLAAGAAAAQVGTALMRCPEAATSAPHRAVLARPGRTAVTRAYTGRRARGIVNRFMLDHDAAAPAAYPEVHHLTAPLRAHGRATGDPSALNLWAGQAHELAEERPAAEVVRALARDAEAALARAARRLGATG